MARKEAIPSEPKQTLAAAARNSTDNDSRPRPSARERLQSSVLEELWSIWRVDPRVPSVKSRRSWAISRDANPRLVDNWFLRRRTCAKKSGQPIPDGSYDLPPDPSIAPKREQSATPIEPELEAVPDLPSDDTLVYPPDSDDLNHLETSSDTVFGEDTFIEFKTETPAYKEVPQQPRPEHHHLRPKPSSADLHAPEDPCDEDNSLFENPSFLVCNQGRGKRSNFTCILCSTESAQGTPDEVLSDFGVTSDSRGNVSIPCPRLDFYPDSDTPSELSAIPFLFRTPSIVSFDNAISHQSATNWTVVEYELGRLVKDGQLDFSFLDVPYLTSMELLD